MVCISGNGYFRQLSWIPFTIKYYLTYSIAPYLMFYWPDLWSNKVHGLTKYCISHNGKLFCVFEKWSTLDEDWQHGTCSIGCIILQMHVLKPRIDCVSHTSLLVVLRSVTWKPATITETARLYDIWAYGDRDTVMWWRNVINSKKTLK